MGDPFYGVDGNLLVEDLPHDFESVEAILNGTFKPTFYAQVFLPSYLMTRYPQLADERAKRRHRREYHARLRHRRGLAEEELGTIPGVMRNVLGVIFHPKTRARAP
jgi:hypothetical protein